MTWVPIPPTLYRTVERLFSGTIGAILWRVLVLAVGLVVLWMLATSGSYILASIAGIVIWMALSSTVRGILIDVWNARGTRL